MDLQNNGNEEINNLKVKSIQIDLTKEPDIAENLKRIQSLIPNNSAGKRIKYKDMISFALSVINDSHIDGWIEKSMTAKERVYAKFEKLNNSNNDLDKEEMWSFIEKNLKFPRQ